MGEALWTLTSPIPNNSFNLSHAIVEVAGSITSVLLLLLLLLLLFLLLLLLLLLVVVLDLHANK